MGESAEAKGGCDHTVKKLCGNTAPPIQKLDLAYKALQKYKLKRA